MSNNRARGEGRGGGGVIRYSTRREVPRKNEGREEGPKTAAKKGGRKKHFGISKFVPLNVV